MNSDCKDYVFKDQIQRASISIMNNIAEGSESVTDTLFIRYLNTAKASCSEVISMLYAGEDLTYYSFENAGELRNKARQSFQQRYWRVIYRNKNFTI